MPTEHTPSVFIIRIRETTGPDSVMVVRALDTHEAMAACRQALIDVDYDPKYVAEQVQMQVVLTSEPSEFFMVKDKKLDAPFDD